MVRFIRQEAEEKAAEIAVSAEEVRKRIGGGRPSMGEARQPPPLSLTLPLPSLHSLFSTRSSTSRS
jgi:hypothetical protein